jgi:predicted nucleotidyltransferase
LNIDQRRSLDYVSRDYVVFKLRERLNDLPEYVKAILLFGSIARGEASAHSDVDLLVLHSGLPITDLVMRRRHLYSLIVERLSDVFKSITLIDMDLESFLKPMTITPLLLNIYFDAIVVIDRVEVLVEFLEIVRKRIIEAGLRRIKDGKAYYWVLPKPLEKVKVI